MSQPIEKYSQIVPMPGQGLRVMKSKLLTALGATGVLRPYIQNTERLIERKILLQGTFNPNPSGPPANDPLVDSFIARQLANGGCALSANTIAALNTFCAGLRTDTLLTKMISVVVFVPDCLIAAITPLITTAGNDPWTNHNFVSGDLSVNGVDDQGSASRYLQTGCNPTNIYASANDSGYSLYGRSDSTACSIRMNAYDGANMAGLYTDAVSIYTGAYKAWDLSPAEYATAAKFVFCSASRTAANAVAVYQANSIIGFTTKGTAAGAPGTRPNLELYMCCWNQSGAPTTFPGGSNHCRYSLAAVHNGLNATDTQNFWNRAQTLRQSLGGGYD
jgi:hypothetical protein